MTDAITMFETVIHPGESKVTTVVAGNHERVSYPVTVPGPVRERVVTSKRGHDRPNADPTNDQRHGLTPAETETVRVP
jgi:hypothetical protein